MKKRVLYIICFVICIVVVILAGELFLSLAYKLTHHSIFSNLASVEKKYPADPQNYIKIAVFGSSTAAGYNSEAGFAEILGYELKKRYPKLKFFIKNYAANGCTFHRAQAEILKSVIKKYDFFLIYAGNNEGWDYLDDIGYFRTEKYKNKKETPRPAGILNNEVTLLSFLQTRSRIYAVIQRLRLKFIKPHIKLKAKSDDIHQIKVFSEFESSKALPEDEIAKININFKNDLEEIGRLADTYKKCVIISSIPINETCKPLFSTHKPGLINKELEAFQKNYEQGLELYNRKEFQRAISYFLAANEIDNHVAILNYMLGYSYLMINDTEKAHQFFVKSSDEDGLLIRALSSLRQIEKDISEKYKSIDFVDTFQIFQELSDRGVKYSELFNDVHHPSLLGHSIIANNFLCKLSKKDPFKSYPDGYTCLDYSLSDVSALVTYYKKELNLTNLNESQNALLIARWYISIANLSAYSGDLLNTAEEALNRFYEISNKTLNDKVTRLVFQALIECKRKNVDLKKAESLVNQAIELSPIYTYNLLSKTLGTGQLILDELNKNGVYFSEKDGKFYI